MKTQLVLFVAVFAIVYTSPLPQAVENVKALEPSVDVAAEPAPVAEETTAEAKSAPAATETVTDVPIEAPATTDAAADPAPVENAATSVADSNTVEEVPEVQAKSGSEAAATPAAETKEVNSNAVDTDTVKLADAVEPAAIASDEVARVVRTNTEDEAKKDVVQNLEQETGEASVTTAAAPAEEKPVEQTEAKSAPVEEAAKPTTAVVTEATAEPTVAVTTPTTATDNKAESAAAAVSLAVTTKPKQDSSEESKESQESDEEKP